VVRLAREEGYRFVDALDHLSFEEGAIPPFDRKPSETSVFSIFVGFVGRSAETGLTKKRRSLREYANLSGNTNRYSGKDASMQDRNLFSLFW
jgi:hypothetical protein